MEFRLGGFARFVLDICPQLRSNLPLAVEQVAMNQLFDSTTIMPNDQISSWRTRCQIS